MVRFWSRKNPAEGNNGKIVLFLCLGVFGKFPKAQGFCLSQLSACIELLMRYRAVINGFNQQINRKMTESVCISISGDPYSSKIWYRYFASN